MCTVFGIRPGTWGKIQIELIAYPKYFELKVQDNGAGISQEHQKNIFDAFYQIEQGKGGSAGLGLAIAKWIIDAHRGHIRVESKPGKVTTFSVALPKK